MALIRGVSAGACYGNHHRLKVSADHAAYKAATPDAMAGFKVLKAMIDDFKENLMAGVVPLLG